MTNQISAELVSTPYGDAVILERFKDGPYWKVKIKFTTTGSELVTQVSNLKAGRVKDPALPSLRINYTVGGVYDTPCGRIKVLDVLPSRTTPTGKKTARRMVIEFVDTGYVCNCQASNVPAGKVKDMRKPSVYGVGYIGADIAIPERGTIVRRLYDLWANMLKRCYHNGGAIGYEDASVDKRWHSFSHFMNTITNVVGYDEWEAGNNMSLDKDIKVNGNRIYSMDTCMFVTASDNSSAASNKRWHGK